MTVGARATSGTALVEALAAIVLVAIAGSVIAAATTANLRALRSTRMLEYMVTLASRELSIAQARGAAEGTSDATFNEPGLGVAVRWHLAVWRSSEGVATLEAAVSAPGAPSVTLTTRMQTSP